MRFDPAALHFMRVQEVPLAPDAASVGLEIRVIGNDSGEKVCSPLEQASFLRVLRMLQAILSYQANDSTSSQTTVLRMLCS